MHVGGMAEGDGEPVGVNILCHLKTMSAGTNSGSYPVGMCVFALRQMEYGCVRERMDVQEDV